MTDKKKPEGGTDDARSADSPEADKQREDAMDAATKQIRKEKSN